MGTRWIEGRAALIVGLFAGIVSAGVGPSAAHAQTEWDLSAWEVLAQEGRVEEYMGREALFLAGGTAWLRDMDFQDGVIEFDIAAPASQGFHGIRFRAAGRFDHEYVYLRPHLSGKSDAVQYTPIYNAISAWQMYSDPRYALPVDIPADRWVHVKLGIQGDRMELSVDGQRLVFPDLVRSVASGGLGIASSAGGARYANFVVRPGADPGFSDDPGAELVEADPGTIESLRLSDSFPEAEIDGVTELPRRMMDSRQWTRVSPHVRGIVNISTVTPRPDENNTVFAAVTLTADEAKTVRLRFGFSDRVRVFLNGRQVYAGADEWSTRDYRFLGTMGLFDEVFLPLEAGANEVWFAVSEDFGGWGVTVQLPDGQDVEVG